LIRRILVIARREWLEQARQPAMLAVVAFLFLAIGGLVFAALALIDLVLRDPNALEDVATWFPFLGADPEGALESAAAGVIAVGNWLIFTQFLGIAAVLAGHAVLHDRQTGTLPFLLLAPVSRAELLAGKILGALGAPLAAYVFVTGATSALAALLPVASVAPDRLPPSPAWLIAFFFGGPAWALFVGAVCAVVSTLAHDVRTAQQVVWFVMFFATFGCGYLLAGLLPLGAGAMLLVAASGLSAAVGAVAIGTQVISRDLSR
jgi:ABC-type Na+ efflux pump permease subunit